jgi:hypothetical protein
VNIDSAGSPVRDFATKTIAVAATDRQGEMAVTERERMGKCKVFGEFT